MHAAEEGENDRAIGDEGGLRAAVRGALPGGGQLGGDQEGNEAKQAEQQNQGRGRAHRILFLDD